MRFSMSTVTMRSAPGEESSDAVPEEADSLDLEHDDVAALQPAAVAVLEDAAGADGARSQDVAWPQTGVACRVRDDRIPRVVHVGELAARALFAVDARGHRSRRPVELVRRHDDRAQARGEVLALRQSEAHLHLRALEIARR